MKETSKTNKYRNQEFFSKYIKGRIIDIGCGDDPIIKEAEPFDIQHGDANQIDKYRRTDYYQTVYSSHCLEHMRNAEAAVLSWWKLVKKGGHLVFIVPDEDLYEQGHWPSIFNKDHKASFRFKKIGTWSPVSVDVDNLIKSLSSAILISVELQDMNYDYNLKSFRRPLNLKLHEKTLKAVEKSKKLPVLSKMFTKLIFKTVFFLGNPIDQTTGYASAQIQIILQKN